MSADRKIFVFDLNGTLLTRVKENKGEVLNLMKPDGIIPGMGDLIYVRPHLDKLIEYLHSNAIEYVLWTTAMEHNGIHLMNAVEKKGMTKSLYKLYHAHSTKIEGHPFKRGKDLSVISNLVGVPVNNIFLIDDEVIKCIPSSSHIPIEEYNILKSKQDTALIKIIEVIKSHMK
ncbi:hypothetical protein NEIRO03_1204 [Nematocida sp. AWRm78]|nr:hypothetical protein NEIRO02_1298 [Nematocida sp. AWRm79]KAI5183624.1 hypothetical protein NEIRO03_1204 [Nematocida sp. AWRm78]